MVEQHLCSPAGAFVVPVDPLHGSTEPERLVNANKLKGMEGIYLHSLPSKEYLIVTFSPKDKNTKVRT